MKPALFDSWTQKYDQWFDTPTGRWIKTFESRLLLDLLSPQAGDLILDVGCGTGLFTRDVMDTDVHVVGVDLSAPMMEGACHRLDRGRFNPACCDMCTLPFADGQFDKVYSMTAIEFVQDVQKAVFELSRVTKKDGSIVITTLNSLSPWADRRKKKAEKGHALFEHIYFRSPEDMRALVPAGARVKTAIHFEKDAPVDQIPQIEEAGQTTTPDKGAFLAVQWNKF